MRIAVAILLLGLPALCFYGAAVNRRARARDVMGKPWRERALDGHFKSLAYAPCAVCMRSYMEPFFIYLEDGKVIGFRARDRLEAARDQR